MLWQKQVQNIKEKAKIGYLIQSWRGRVRRDRDGFLEEAMLQWSPKGWVECNQVQRSKGEREILGKGKHFREVGASTLSSAKTGARLWKT